MVDNFSERRLAENEVFFREANQNISKGFKELKDIANEEGDEEWAKNADEPINFYCECSNIKCRERIGLKPSEYENIHKNSSQFAVLPGHNIPEIERIVNSSENYLVVEKNIALST